MPWYKCFIAGENFPGELVGELKAVGFFTTRFVEADSLQAAEVIALANLKMEPRLRLSPEVMRSTNPKVYFESIEEVESAEVPERNSGFSFFVMDT